MHIHILVTYGIRFQNSVQGQFNVFSVDVLEIYPYLPKSLLRIKSAYSFCFQTSLAYQGYWEQKIIFYWYTEFAFIISFKKITLSFSTEKNEAIVKSQARVWSCRMLSCNLRNFKKIGLLLMSGQNKKVAPKFKKNKILFQKLWPIPGSHYPTLLFKKLSRIIRNAKLSLTNRKDTKK